MRASTLTFGVCAALGAAGPAAADLNTDPITAHERVLMKVTPGLTTLPSPPTPYDGINCRLKLGGYDELGVVSEYDYFDGILDSRPVAVIEFQPNRVSDIHSNFWLVYVQDRGRWHYTGIITQSYYPVRLENDAITATNVLSRTTGTKPDNSVGTETWRVDGYHIRGTKLVRAWSHTETHDLGPAIRD